MTGPKLVLPADAMPWGRWVEEATSKTAERIRDHRSDLSSIGSQFSSRADLIGGQIAGITSISTQYTHEFEPYELSKSAGSLGDPNVMLQSPPVTFVPPKPTGLYRLLVFGNMNAVQTAGTGNLDFTWTYLSVAGRIYRQPALEENRPGATGSSMTKIASVSAWDAASFGSPTTVRMGLSVNANDAKTVSFSDCTITAVYVGGI